MTLKLLEITEPSTLTLTSKDGLDIGGTSSVGLIALLSLSHKKKWSEEELDKIRYVLFGPTLLNRERVIHPERFDRLHHLLCLLENHTSYLDDFSGLFQSNTLIMRICSF